MLKLPADKGPLIASLIALAGPIAVQNLIGSSLNLVDNVMIGSLGAASIAGVALANQIFFLLILFSFAIGSGTAIFTAQFWGKGDLAAIRRSLGLCLTFMMSGSLLFFAAAQIAPGFLIGIFSTDPEVIATGSRFLRIMSWGFLFQAVTMSYVNVLRSIERVRMPLVASVVSLALCTFLNWALIFGNLGLPALGVEGSAIATVIARALEMSIIVGSVYLRRQPDGSPHHLAASPRELLGFGREYLGKFWKVTLPVVGNEMGWALGFTIPTIVFARMGTDSIAAYNIADTAIRLVLVVFFGTTAPTRCWWVSASAKARRKRPGPPPISSACWPRPWAPSWPWCWPAAASSCPSSSTWTTPYAPGPAPACSSSPWTCPCACSTGTSSSAYCGLAATPPTRWSSTWAAPGW
jgi:putative MATE family efflux protein